MAKMRPFGWSSNRSQETRQVAEQKLSLEATYIEILFDNFLPECLGNKYSFICPNKLCDSVLM